MSFLSGLLTALAQSTPPLTVSGVRWLLAERDRLFAGFLAGELSREEFLDQWGDLCCSLELHTCQRTHLVREVGHFTAVYERASQGRGEAGLGERALRCQAAVTALLSAVGSPSICAVGVYHTDDGICLPVALPILVAGGGVSADITPAVVFASLDDKRLRQLVFGLQKIYAE